MTTYKINDKSFYCPVELTLSAIGGKWKVLLLWKMHARTMRYGEFRKALPEITHKMLSQSLKEMERDGLVIRKVYNVVPPMVEYSLSEEGLRMMPVLDSMMRWGIQYGALIDTDPEKKIVLKTEKKLQKIRA